MSLPDPLQTRIDIIPGYDHRDDPSGKRGAHNMAFRFILQGFAGAITWELNTGWMERPLTGGFIPGQVQQRRDKPGADGRLWDYSPSAGAVSSHSRSQLQDYDLGPQACDVLGGECWGNTGYLIGDSVLEAMFKSGHEGVWAKLTEIYNEWLTPESSDSSSTGGEL